MGIDRITVLPDNRTEPRCFRDGEEIVFCGYFPSEKGCGIIFYDAAGKDPVQVKLPEECGIGRLYSVRITGIPAGHDRYRLFDRNGDFADPFSFRVYGLGTMDAHDESVIYGSVFKGAPDDFLKKTHASRLKSKTPPCQELIYLLHVRGFTMSPSAGIAKDHRGTFAGIVDKLDHILSLGVTAVELMPSYELIARETYTPETYDPTKEKTQPDKDKEPAENEPEERINYWGYKEGFYMAPRSAYSVAGPDRDPCREFHVMAEALHKKGIALILQFWFPREYPTAVISAVLRHWVRFYGVDGFHLIGGGLNVESLAADPALAGIRMYYEQVDPSRIAGDPRMSAASSKKPSKNLFTYRDDFRTAARRFLKSDDHSLTAFFNAMINNDERTGHVNYLADFGGMRLVDTFSYEHKHNEANRENNQDGTDHNDSWNCGIEGKTRRTGILKLRRKQIFNALTMLFFAQGTPMIYAGDEFLHSQEGNNNPYCQDNAISWINWRQESSGMSGDVADFVRFLSDYRRHHHMLTQEQPLKLMDYKAFGYPDLSAHGQDAWQPDFSGFSHSIGMLYCNLYAKEQNPAFLYCIYNCHWEGRRFALPALPKPLTWTAVIDTARTGEETKERRLTGEKSVALPGRSILILESRGKYRMSGREERTPF
ncbi:MAG: hypothetical protein IKO80_00700 [Lachnospiraceae bacterium]|nr:hypothetical protein [Lachnospiraceae bacterium]